MPLRENPYGYPRHIRCQWCNHFIPVDQLIFHQVDCGKQPAVTLKEVK